MKSERESSVKCECGCESEREVPHDPEYRWALCPFRSGKVLRNVSATARSNILIQRFRQTVRARPYPNASERERARSTRSVWKIACYVTDSVTIGSSTGSDEINAWPGRRIEPELAVDSRLFQVSRTRNNPSVTGRKPVRREREIKEKRVWRLSLHFLRLESSLGIWRSSHLWNDHLEVESLVFRINNLNLHPIRSYINLTPSR